MKKCSVFTRATLC